MTVEYAKHQIDAISFQQVQPYSILAMSTGTGKTLTTIGSMLVNLKTNKLDKCIFVCTKGSLDEVQKDFNKFYKFSPIVLNNQNDIISFFREDKTIALTRYEKLKYFDYNLIEELSSSHKLGMWWDEAQRLKNGSMDSKGVSGTQAHKKARELRCLCSAFHLVTATPIMCTLNDLWALMHLVDYRILGSYFDFCNNFYERRLVPHPRYRRRQFTCPTCGSPLEYYNGFDYCMNPFCQSIRVPGGFIPFRRQVKSIWELVEYKNIEVLSNIIKPYMFCYFPKQDIIYKMHEFCMSNDTENRYNLIAKDLFLNEYASDNSNKEKSSNNNTPFSTRIIELQYVIDRSSEKLKELYKLAIDLKDKGFVLYVPLYSTSGNHSSQSTLDIIFQMLENIEGLEVKTYTGNDSDDDKKKNKEWFIEDSKNKCLIISEAGGASLNLQSTNEFIFYSMPYGFGKISQALGRIVRLFSKYKTFNIHVIQAKDSIDVYKFNCFLMMTDVIYRLMNNKLIDLKTPINYNNDLKTMMRNQLCWNK